MLHMRSVTARTLRLPAHSSHLVHLAPGSLLSKFIFIFVGMYMHLLIYKSSVWRCDVCLDLFKMSLELQLLSLTIHWGTNCMWHHRPGVSHFLSPCTEIETGVASKTNTEYTGISLFPFCVITPGLNRWSRIFLPQSILFFSFLLKIHQMWYFLLQFKILGLNLS